jgi:hypothetical protein
LWDVVAYSTFESTSFNAAVSAWPATPMMPFRHLPVNAAGCIPNDYWDYGVAVGPLNVPSGVFFPVRIRITGWSDGSAVSDLVQSEPVFAS